jgi:hypothetical protein
MSEPQKARALIIRPRRGRRFAHYAILTLVPFASKFRDERPATPVKFAQLVKYLSVLGQKAIIRSNAGLTRSKASQISNGLALAFSPLRHKVLMKEETT